MGYSAITLGIDDLQLSSVELVQVASSDPGNPGEFITANIVVWGDDSLFPSHRIIEAGGRRIGITAALGNEFKDQIQSEDIEFLDPIERLKTVVGELLEKKCDFVVLLAHASLEESAEMGRQVDGVDLVVTAGGYGEPTLHPTAIEGSDAVMVQVGTKGMYGGIVGLFDDETTPIRYQKIAISSQFKDSPRMLEKFAEYQERLKNVGLDGLGVKPISHPTGRKFVGSESCGDCHTTAFEIWEDTPHVHATDSIVAANNDRGGIPRHHDPECISCHATGWNAQEYYPYETGFISPEQTEHLVGSGCENCHGPGKDHVDAEYGDVDVDNDTLLKLRQQMVLRLDQARDKCLQCHDLDNSPDFHVEGAFEEYWEQVKHYGKD
ncbi:MAG: cytochrome C554, partial [bacterium]|nr:cytochrome C554 [bacterium]